MDSSKNIKLRLLCLTILFSFSNHLFAQSDEGKDGSIEKEINVIKPYEPVINDAFKINVAPRFHDSIPDTKEFEYTLRPKIAHTSFSPEPIDAIKLKGELLNKLYQCHVKLGMGTYSTPYAEVFVNNLRSVKYSVGAHARHLSSFGTIDEVGYSGYSENNLDVYGKKFYKNAVLSGSIGYDRHGGHFYGFSESDTIIDKADIRQVFNYVEGKAGYYSIHNEKKKLSYNTGLKTYYLADSYKTVENNFQINTTLGRTLETLRVEADVNLYYNHLLTTIDTANEYTLSLTPIISTQIDNLYFGVGISPNLDVDTVPHIRFYPNVEATYKLIGDFVSIYATLKGKLKQNNFKNITDENPFVVSSPLLVPTNEKVVATIGTKGIIGLYLPYDFHVSYGIIENMPFFVTDTIVVLQNKFNIVYDTIQLLQVHAELAYQKIEKFKITAKGDYYYYKLNTELYPWHKPTFMLTLSAEYQLQNKIIAKADIIGKNTFYAKTYNSLGEIVPVKMKGIADVNLGVEYRYTERLSAFITANNLLSMRYQPWYNYPNQRILILGGVSFSF